MILASNKLSVNELEIDWTEFTFIVKKKLWRSSVLMIMLKRYILILLYKEHNIG